MLNSNVFVYNFLTSLSGLFCGWQSCHQSRVMRFRAGSAYNCCYFVISGWHWSTLHPICGNNVCVLQIVDLFFLKVKLFFLHLCHSSYHKWNTVHSICQLAPKLCFISLCEGGNYFLFFKKQTFLLHQKQDVFFCCEKQSNNLKKDNHESWGLSSYIKIDNWWAGFFNDTLSSETIKKGGESEDWSLSSSFKDIHYHHDSWFSRQREFTSITISWVFVSQALIKHFIFSHC